MLRHERDGWMELFRRDAARWVEPGHVHDHDTLRPRTILTLLLRHPPLRALAWMRFGGWLRVVGVRGGPSYVQRRLLRLYGLEIAPGAAVGGGCYIAHPSGCTLSARIGENATIVACVTVGSITGRDWPTLGDNVYLGAGCRVLGDINLGDNVKVGANAVVIDDVVANTTVVGVPAHPTRQRIPTCA